VPSRAASEDLKTSPFAVQGLAREPSRLRVVEPRRGGRLLRRRARPRLRLRRGWAARSAR